MYENMSYEVIKNNILSKIQGLDKREGSFINDMVSPISMELEGNYTELEKILSQMFLKDLTSDDLDKRAAEYGINRKNGTYSVGIVTVTGTENTVIPKGTLLSTSTGLNFVTTEEKAIGSDAAVDVAIKAVDIGTVYNVEAGKINTLSVGIVGVLTVENKEKLVGGTDKETDSELLNRLLLRLRTPATSGNKHHYKQWALEVPGIGDAKVFPLWDGNGTVLIMPITTDKVAPNESLINNVAAKIELERPIGAIVTVEAPVEVPINIEAEIEIEVNYELQNIINIYTEKITEYIKDSVFKMTVVDYFKCLSLFYEIEGVKAVESFILNGNTSNIIIGEKQIQTIGTINITV